MSTVDMSAVEAKEAIAEQEMRDSVINNEELLLMEPVVVHRDRNGEYILSLVYFISFQFFIHYIFYCLFADDEGADDDSDSNDSSTSTSSEDTDV